MADDVTRLPGASPVEDGPPDQLVCHVDMDCFYAACERLREPALRGEPVVVGMGYEAGDDTGAVATASYEAREYGVDSAMAITTALERLPRREDADPDDPDAPNPEDTGLYRPVDLDYYQEVGAQVKDILHECADVVREVSIDEAYLDVTDRTNWEVVEGFARHVKQRIAREVGVAASVGVAPTMSAAKVASDHDKPDGLVVVTPEELVEFLAPLDVEDVHGVGPVTARKLREEGIENAGDLADADRDALVDQFGERGGELHDRARGRDYREVTPRGDPKSFSRESAFGSPVTDAEPKREQVRTLAAAVAERAQREGALYRTIGVKAVEPPFDVNTRERSLPGPVDDPALVESAALDLFAEFEDVAVRKVGVRVANLSFTDRDQPSLASFSGDGSATESDAGATAENGDESGRDDGSSEREDGAGERENAEENATDGDDDESPAGDGHKTHALPPGQTSLTDF
ncbi:DNA polymerase IV [Halorubellus litoreus]|uniref:DNA polymerase IV n=1 Tax=Halorubellus litoreus TaxID=755308 RepID=A0ABD5VGE0_9EURY